MDIFTGLLVFVGAVVLTMLIEKLIRTLKSRDILSAAKVGNLKKVIFFVAENRANVKITNNKGETALMLAISHYHVDVAKFLIDKGSELDIKNKDGLSALHLSIIMVNIDIIECLIKRGADINIKDDGGGLTPLMWASFECPLNVVKCLVENGADINLRDNMGDTALKMASDNRDLIVVEYLKNKGAVL